MLQKVGQAPEPPSHHRASVGTHASGPASWFSQAAVPEGLCRKGKGRLLADSLPLSPHRADCVSSVCSSYKPGGEKWSE